MALYLTAPFAVPVKTSSPQMIYPALLRVPKCPVCFNKENDGKDPHCR